MKRAQNLPGWQVYEEAVARFIQAIDPKALVTHNVRRPDYDTGRLRQYDVWVEALVGGLFRINILVSCKKLSRRVNVQDIDALVGELRSSGAHMGAMFANSGFTEPAIAKAKRLGIACCRIYASQPADLPEVLPLQLFFCSSSIMWDWDIPGPEWSLKTFRDLLALEIEQEDGGHASLGPCLAQIIAELHAEGFRRRSSRHALPEEFMRSLTIIDDEKGYTPFRVEVGVRWQVFRARPQAMLLNGAYSYSDTTFLGTVLLPIPALEGEDPGPDWERLGKRPGKNSPPGVTLTRSVEASTIAKLLADVDVDLEVPRNL